MTYWVFIAAVVAAGWPSSAFGQQKGGKQSKNLRLTKPPQLVEQVDAEYTDRAVDARIEGGVKLRLTISATGEVTDVEVLDSLGHGLDDAAVAAAKQFVFTPAEINNQPAPVTLDFTVNFSLPSMPATLRGRLVDADAGKPIAGAAVGIEYVGQEYESTPAADTTSNADGGFSFSNVPPGPYRVTIEAAEYQTRSERVELGSDETVEVTYRFSKSPVNLRGEIRQAGTRKPLAGVEVHLAEADTGKALRDTYTDAEAKFAFRGLPAGAYRLTFEADGFESLTSEQTVAADQVTSGAFYLQAQYYDEYTVKTTARREQTEISRKRIDKKELERIPGANGDVVRVVQNMPGVARPSYVGGNLIVRGAAPEDTKVFLQGDAIPLVFHFLGGPAVVGSEMLDSVDFYPGNFSAYYGRATGGIVALRTRSPRKDRFHGFAEIDLLDATAQFEGPITDELSFGVSARRSYVDALLPALAPDDLTDQVTVAPRYYDYQGWLTWRPSEAYKLELFLYGSDDQVATVFDDDEPRGNANVQIDGVSYGQFFHRGQIRWEWTPPGEPIETELSASFGLNSLGIEAGEDLNFVIDYYQTQIRQDVRIEAADNFGLRFGADLQLGAAAYSLDVPRTDRGRGGPGPNLSPDGLVADETVPVMQPGFYVEGEYKPHKRLKLTPGLRVDHYGAIGATSVSPRLTSRWRLVDDLTLKGGVGLFTQPPLPNESGTVFGTDDITYEKAIHYALGGEWRILDYLELDTTLFYRDMNDLIKSTSAVDAGSNGQFEDVRYTNLGQGRAYGAEIMLRHYPQNRFFGWIAYTLSRAERYDPINEVYEPFEYDQTHILTMVAGYNLPYHIDVSSRFRLVSGSPYTPVVGAVWDADQDEYQPINGASGSARHGTFHQLDVRVDKKFIYDTFILGVYVEVINAYNAANEEGRDYNYDYTETKPVSGLPIIPTIGVNGRF